MESILDRSDFIPVATATDQYKQVCGFKTELYECDQILDINQSIYIWEQNLDSATEVTICSECNDYFDNAETRAKGWKEISDDDEEDE